MTFFCPSALNHLLYNESIFTRTQRPAKRAHDYNSTVQKLASRLPALYKGILKCKILRGLQPQVKAFCLQQATETINDIIAAAKIAETADVAATDRNISELSEIRGEIRTSRLASYIDNRRCHLYNHRLLHDEMQRTQQSLKPSHLMQLDR